MRLKSISYTDKIGRENQWSYDELVLNNINLVVGYNASGKTRTIDSIKAIASLVAGEVSPFKSSEEFRLELIKKSKVYEYQLKILDGKVIYESLYSGTKRLLIRDEEKNISSIFYSELDKDLDFSIEKDTLAVIGKRDKVQHPFIEDIVNWGKYTFHYAFGSDMGKRSLLIDSIDDEDDNYTKSIKDRALNPKSASAVVGYFKLGLDEYGAKFKNDIIDQMSTIGYNLTDIDLDYVNFNLENESGKPLAIYVKEEDLKGRINQNEMSQGMFRALSIIIHTTVCIYKELSSLILIDDIGEGLDYNRSTQLINMLIDKGMKSDIQMIMTTNDRFVMNNVDLKYWQVIVRDHGNCRYFNYSNSRSIFDDFKFIGLSNFDFLSSDFLNNRYEV